MRVEQLPDFEQEKLEFRISPSSADITFFAPAFTDVPGPIPAAPVVADTGRNWVSLTWPKPEPTSSAPVIAYRIEAWQKGGDGPARWVELGVTPLNGFDAFNLKPWAEYQFRVTPRNRYGWGESVQSDTIVVGKCHEIPEFVRTLPGQVKVLKESIVNLECEVKEVGWFSPVKVAVRNLNKKLFIL